jgi:predicted lipoprotein with Yx(FWY)xxD motif
MFNKRLLGGIFALALAGAACANDAGGSTPLESADEAATEGAASSTPANEEATAGDALAGALLGTSPAGDIIVGPDGRALYGFTNDTAAASTCYGTCADAWPPVIVGQDWTVGPGLDTGIFATTVRDDGQLQLVAGKWPLYYYAGDAVPGDINGQASGDVWYLVNPDGGLITDAEAQPADDASAEAQASGPVSVGETDLGPVVVDGDGLTLYGFTNDVDGVPSCYDDCADAWPPMLVDSAELPDGLDPEVFSVIERTDGTFQLVAGKWPLYRFAGDAAPGDVGGQNSGDVWFAAAPDGSLIKDGELSTNSSDTEVPTDSGGSGY